MRNILQQGNANVQVEDSGTVPNVFSGYCQTGTSTVTFTNNGAEVDPGFGAMLNLEVGIGMGNGFNIADGGFFITARSTCVLKAIKLCC